MKARAERGQFIKIKIQESKAITKLPAFGLVWWKPCILARLMDREGYPHGIQYRFLLLNAIKKAPYFSTRTESCNDTDKCDTSRAQHH